MKENYWNDNFFVPKLYNGKINSKTNLGKAGMQERKKEIPKIKWHI